PRRPGGRRGGRDLPPRTPRVERRPPVQRLSVRPRRVALTYSCPAERVPADSHVAPPPRRPHAHRTVPELWSTDQLRRRRPVPAVVLPVRGRLQTAHGWDY